MAAPVLESIDALLTGDPAALDDRALGESLRALGRARARLDAAELAAVAEFDRRQAFTGDGMLNTKTWLAHETGVARKTAGYRVQQAKRLARFPLLGAVLAEGRVTEGHVTAMGRTLTPRTMQAAVRDEAMLVGYAVTLDADDFERVIATWRAVNDPGPDPGGDEPSRLHVSALLAGRVRIDGELDLEDGVEFRAELEARYDELWHADQAADDTDPLKHRTPSQRYAAALIDICRRSSAAGDTDTDTDGAHHDEAHHHDPAAAEATPARRPRTKQIIAVVDIDTLAGDPTGRAELEDGTPIPHEVLHRWACDSAIGRVVMRGASITVDVGRLTHTATDAQRRALTARDRGCIIPGCKRKPRWCQAHHVQHWEHGGPTNLTNLVLLCHRHHKHVHRDHIILLPGPTPGRWTATRPDGTPLRQRPPPTLAA